MSTNPGLDVPVPPKPDLRDPNRQHVQPGGRRELTLTLQDVADVLRCDVRTVKKLIRNGVLRAIRVSPRLTRVTERALGEYLHPRADVTAHQRTL